MRTTLVLVAAAMLVATAAQADAIDGDWCRPDGKRLSIRGPDIVTPGGKAIRGDYTRHSFQYVVPAGEAGTGDTVQIILRNEHLAHARQGDDTAVQEWRRCPATTS
jgi:hypothetical protein